MAFSKSNLLKELQEQADYLQQLHFFTTDTGDIQVVGKDGEVNRAYGEWIRIRQIITAIREGYLGYGS